MSGNRAMDYSQSEITYDMIYLSACALHNVKPDADRIRRINLKHLYRICHFHNLTAIVCMALEETDVLSVADPALAKKWKDAKAKAIRKNMLLDAEREQILAEMEQSGIWHMPLKGSILQRLYPKYGMRQMADNDILFDAGRQKQLVEIMKRRGYRVKSYGKCNHDVFMKEPVYNFEMHTGLFEKFSDSAWYQYNNIWYHYYKNVKDKLLLDEGTSYCYHFTDEDFYLYMTVHTYKHYRYSGVGIRSLLDSYLYIMKKGSSMNWEYIVQESDAMKMKDFEERSRLLAKKLFSSPVWVPDIELTDKEEEMLSYFINSGTYGTTKNYVENRLRETGKETGMLRSKVYYVYRRLIPTMTWFEKHEPFFAKHKILIPFFLIYRFFRRLFGRKKIINELRAMQEFGKKG